MAINPSTQYPGKTSTPDPNYPYGGAQNITVPGDGTGTPWEAALLNDIFGFQQSLLLSSGIVPSGTPDKSGISQYFQAIVEMISGRSRFLSQGAGPNAITLSAKTGQQNIASLFDGFSCRFTATTTNTGSMTANVSGTGVKNIVDELGNALVAGVVIIGHTYELYYDLIDYTLTNINRKTAGLNTKKLVFSGWNMDTTAVLNVAHGLTFSKIRGARAWINANGFTGAADLAAAWKGGQTGVDGINADGTNIILQRAVLGSFDNASFNNANGWVFVDYDD